MAVETPASHLIIFIAAITVAVVVAGAMSLATDNFVGSLEDKGERKAKELAADVSILNDPTHMVYNRTTRELTLYVKNTGSISLAQDQVEVYVNGSYWEPTSVALMGGASSWQTSKTLQVDLELYMPAGDHSLRVVVQYGAYDSLDFRLD